MRLTEITAENAEKLKFSGSAGNANCELRALRRMLHKAEEWKLISRAPKIKLMKEHGRSLRFDDLTMPHIENLDWGEPHDIRAGQQDARG